MFVANSISIHRGIRCAIDWTSLDEGTICLASPVEWLQCVAAALGGPRLASLCKRLCMNYNYFASGLPDLVLCRRQQRADGNPSVLFVEVKGERDRLSEKQMDWVEFFQQNAINFELCKVAIWALNEVVDYKIKRNRCYRTFRETFGG